MQQPSPSIVDRAAAKAERTAGRFVHPTPEGAREAEQLRTHIRQTMARHRIERVELELQQLAELLDIEQAASIDNPYTRLCLNVRQEELARLTADEAGHG